MNRRHFVQSSLAASAALLTSSVRAQSPTPASTTASANSAKFKLNYAPHPGMFKEAAGSSVIDQIKFAADQGFTAWEDNGMMGRPVAEQEAIGQTLADRGMKMGVFVAYASFDEPTFAVPNAAKQEEILTQLRGAVDVAKRCGAKWFTVVPGSVDQQSKSTANWNKYGGPRLAGGYQTANAIDLLRRCAAIFEPHGLVMVLEALNWYRDHGGTFLEKADQSYALCRAVNSPACKVLFDIYHMQIAGGNLIPNLDLGWSEIAYLQIGDNPGRKEPGTGEINYRNIFRHVHTKGFTGVLGMEHGNSQPGKDGELAVIRAYRDADNF